MPNYAWSDDLATGLAQMDADHQRLIEMISRLDGIGTGKGSRDDIHTILMALAAYTKDHIAHEEGLMARSGYKDAAAHKAQHAVFVNKVGEFIGAFDGGADITGDMTMFLYRWLVDHINKTDKLLVWSLANLDTAETD
jgi:hemerythrin-like metal-binding protein